MAAGDPARPVPSADDRPVRINLAPGPSQLLPLVPAAAARFLSSGLAGLNHRSPEFTGLMRELDARLRRCLALPDEFRLYYVSSATYAMELVLRNLVRRRCAALVAGAFGERFAQVAALIGREAALTRLETGSSLEGWRAAGPGRRVDHLFGSTAWREAEAWLLCHNETAAGTALPLDLLPAADSLRLVDCVSSAGAQRLPWAKADLWFFSVQKAFGCPPGLAVIAAGPRALERARELEAEGRDTGAWFSFSRLEDNARRHQTPCTPNSLGLALLSAAAERLAEEGAAPVEERCRAMRDRCVAWLDRHPVLRPAVPHPVDRSLTVTAVARRDGGSLAGLEQALRREGIVVGGGYGDWRGTSLRLAHFPAHAMADLEETLATMDRLLDGGMA